MSINIVKVGKTPAGCTVYRIKGLGYWIAPKAVNIVLTVKDRCTIIRNVAAKNVLQLSCGDTPSAFYDAAELVLRHIENDIGLWLTTSQCVTNPPAVQIREDGYAVTIPVAIRKDKTRFYTSNRQKAELKAKEYHDELYKRYHVTLRDALTFHLLCPPLRK